MEELCVWRRAVGRRVGAVMRVALRCVWMTGRCDVWFGGELGLQCVCRLYGRVLLLFYLEEVFLA